VPLALQPVLISVKATDHHLAVVQCDVEGVGEVVTGHLMVAEAAVVVGIVVVIKQFTTNQTFVISVYIFFIFFVLCFCIYTNSKEKQLVQTKNEFFSSFVYLS
jgi:hypothetical protein